MACYHPITCWYAKHPNPSGKTPLVFNPTQAADPHDPLDVPCGQCIGCRLERSRQWAVRCMHEASLHENNCFITLTFDDKSLFARENPCSVDIRDFQLFMKRLRKLAGPDIRYFHCGEYGDQFSRPHYHACLFNFDFPDKQLWSTRDDVRLYTSKILEKLWPYGFSTIGDVTFQSAAYVARYVTKKVTGDNAADHYLRASEDTGEIFTVKPEYISMSRRPGIGKPWFDKYLTDVYPSDFIIVNGQKVKPPKFYDKLLELELPFEYDHIKHKREQNAQSVQHELTWQRLQVKETLKLSQISKLKRNLE